MAKGNASHIVMRDKLVACLPRDGFKDFVTSMSVFLSVCSYISKTTQPIVDCFCVFL